MEDKIWLSPESLQRFGRSKVLEALQERVSLVMHAISMLYLC